MATAAASRLLPKIVHPATQLCREDHGKITVEARRLTSATGPRAGLRPRSCLEMSVENLLNSQSTRPRLTSSRLRHTRTCSARQQRVGQSVAGGGQRLPQFSTTEEVYSTCMCTTMHVTIPDPFLILKTLMHGNDPGDA